jgi:hypothetical protein
MVFTRPWPQPLLLLVSLVALACSGPVHERVPGSDAEHPRLRFLDGSVSMNDRCAVTGATLNPHMDALYVNGRAIGFC